MHNRVVRTHLALRLLVGLAISISSSLPRRAEAAEPWQSTISAAEAPTLDARAAEKAAAATAEAEMQGRLAAMHAVGTSVARASRNDDDSIEYFLEYFTESPSSTLRIDVDSVFWARVRNASVRPIVIESDPIYPGPTVLAAGEVAPGTQIGPRLGATWSAEGEGAWEAGWFSLFGGAGQRTATGSNNLAIPGDLGLASLNFFNADTIQARNAATQHSFEFNRSRPLGHVELLGGMRYMHLRESFDLVAGDLDTSATTYQVAARNNLWGGQLGLRLSDSIGRFSWSAHGKAALLANFARQSQSVFDFPGPIPLRDQTSGSGTNTAMYAETELALRYQLAPRWTLRGGYTVAWLSQVALAADQLDFTFDATSGTHLSNSAVIMQHGAFAGLEARW